MELNLLLAGVGGQGILSIAQALSLAAIRRGWHVKQSEVHGMAQRGGAVQAHLRLADHELFSDLIPIGRADMVLAIEPLESLRYLQYLSDTGTVVSSTNAFVNITDYPPIEQVLDRISRTPRHVLIDADQLGQAAGSARCANTVLLGAASVLLGMELPELDESVRQMFASKGEAVVAMNQRALRLGRRAAAAYTDGLARGGAPRAVRKWLARCKPDDLMAGHDLAGLELADDAGGDLTQAERTAVAGLLKNVFEQDRLRLYEHEVYSLVHLVGAIEPPRHVYLRRGTSVTTETLSPFRGERLVLKLVAQQVVHKTEARAVVFVPNDAQAVQRECERLIAAHAAAGVEGVLIVEFVEQAQSGLGSELFVGIRATREFGPVIAAGLGGVDTEYLASKMRPGVAVAKAVALDVTAEQFLELFRRTAAYELLSGQTRGHRRIVSDGDLLRCFRAFLSLAKEFCVPRDDGPSLTELEVNPFAFRQQRMLPLDGRGRMGSVAPQPPPRPFEKTAALIAPRSIAVLGVSAAAMNFGRIILRNIIGCGFPREHVYVIKDHPGQIDDVRCIPRIDDVPETIDLLVVAAGADALPDVVGEACRSGKVQSGILIPAGVGETEGSDDLKLRLSDVIAASRGLPGGGPVFVGPNCLGVQSRIGRYDTFFVPEDRLDMRWSAPARRVAMISQSGAFVITRLSNLECLDPAVAISLGNQIDLTVSDALRVLARRDDIDVIGVYMEGFNDWDGLAFLKAVEQARSVGKEVVFYKAGRTPQGRSAAAGHTASLAGDYDVCQASAARAGAIVVDTFKEFEQLLDLATALHGRTVNGRRLAAITNAGSEAVAMADNIRGVRYDIEMAELADATQARLRATLARHRLESLVNARNPLDLTPMADDAAFEECARIFLESDEVDALIISCVPFSATLKTTPQQLDRLDSLAQALPRVFKETHKPLAFVLDCGGIYEALAKRVHAAGVPVFRSCDQAVRSMGRYVHHRAAPPVASIEDNSRSVADSPELRVGAMAPSMR